jgi:branched-chain amino acid transport system substrate-binding protein
MKKFVIGLIVVLIVIGVVWMLGEKDKSSKSTSLSKEKSSNTYKIGFIGPLTGDGATYGEPFRNMVAMAAEEINKNGGVSGKRLEFVYEDAKCNGRDGANAMQKLAQVEKVQVVIGGFCSSESLAAVPIAEKGKILLFSPGSSSPALTGKSKYFFRNYPSDSMQGAVLSDLAYNDQKWKSVAFIMEQKDYPVGLYKSFDESFTKLGGKTIKEEFAPEVSDFRSQLTKLQAGSPDALFIDAQTPAAAERILKQVTELGWDVPLIIADAIAGDPKTIENNKEILEGAFAAEFGVDPENKKFKMMIDNYKKKYGEEPPYQSYAQTEYDAVYLIAEGLKKVGYDGAKLAEWSRTVKDWDGASGKITIEGNGDRAGGFVVKVVKDGKVEIFKK